MIEFIKMNNHSYWSAEQISIQAITPGMRELSCNKIGWVFYQLGYYSIN